MAKFPSGVINLREIGAPAAPATGQVLLYVKSDGLVYAKDDAGIERVLGQGGTEVPNLAAVVTPADNDVFHLVAGGVSKKISLNQLTSYIESRGRQVNASVAQQTWAAADAYLVGSDVSIPASRLQPKSVYRCRFGIAKTSTAGTATPIVNIRVGTAGTTADTARATLTFAAQTAVADDGFIDVYCTFRTVGSGTSAVIRAEGLLDHRLAATGLSTANTSIAVNTGAGFDSTVANLKIGCSVTWGTSFVGTTNLVQAELMNLA
jgi:hypothetical protein